VVCAISTSSAAVAGFPLGVAAGDVLADRAVLWTRVDRLAEVWVEVAIDPEFTRVVELRAIEPDELRDTDLTAKFEVRDLAPATEHYYRFWHTGETGVVYSTVGRFRTAPPDDQPAALRFVFSGDSNFRYAPMTAMASAARENADIFVWFGDTIYADVPAGGLGAAVTLDDYRAKYRQMRGDPNVQALAAATAALVGWDDHEVTNDYAGTDPVLTPAQRDGAYRAFFEYMPIRPQNLDGDGFRTYRRIRYGALVEFFLLDGRQYREVSAEATCGGNPDPDGFALGLLTRDAQCRDALRGPRTMLGEAQWAWLLDGLASSTACYKFIVNSVPMSYVGVAPYDRWDGYDAERKGLLEFIDQNRIEGVVILATDIHANGFNPDVMSYFRRQRRDYDLSNGIVVPEIIAGPIGNETASQTVAEAGGAFLGGARGLVGPIEQFFLNRVARVNRMDFINPDRVGYAVIDIAADGRMTLAYRGLTPGQTPDPTAEAQTFFEGAVGFTAGGAAPCFLPLAAAGALGLFACRGRVRNRAGSRQ
jgi:alkaline phosphatase D